MSQNLKERTTRALIWGSIDKIFTQLCYAVTGVVLANILTSDDFGLMAIIGVFIAFVNIFIDSGFSLALVQKKHTNRKDYSTVFFFNIALSTAIYVILYFCAPLIADYFGNEKLVLLSRVMFLNVFFVSFGLVQSSMLMKQMNVKKQTSINVISLFVCSILALYMALHNFGVWALVAQALVYSFVRTLLLWVSNRWIPLLVFSKESFKNIFSVGSHLLLTSFVRTLFQNIYTLIIGRKYSLSDLGYYNQADKWSKMGTMALTQTMGAAAFPALSSIQDDEERMRNVFRKMNRMTSYVCFPAFIWLIVMAEPVFHCFFGTKWDLSIIFFQLLVVKGILFTYISLLNNYIMATGKTRIIFRLEVIKDTMAIVGIVITLPISIYALVVGQVIIESIHHMLTVFFTSRRTGYSVKNQLWDVFPYLAISISICPVLFFLDQYIENSYILVVTQSITAILLYVCINRLLKSKIQQEIFQFIRKRFRSA